ncbi:MAG: glycosyltransferase family 2 protein [Comamonadaceae bacterium]|nr:glycosyltransferase family 2 protein [Comamonadaceae bacterium]
MKDDIDWIDDAIRTPAQWPNEGEFLRRCDAAFDELELRNDLVPFDTDKVTLVTVMRNEERMLPAFFEHYRSLGVQAFHVIDNGSVDRTAAIVREQESATLWYTEASYRAAACGCMWVGAIVRRYGLGTWVLHVDADEFMVYPGMERHDINALVAALERRGQSRCSAPMLEMYADDRQLPEGSMAVSGDHSVSGLAPWTSVQELIGRYPYFDSAARGRSYRMVDYGHGMIGFHGGARMRMRAQAGWGSEFWIGKTPLARWHERTAYGNIHVPWPFHENPRALQTALLHFKLTNGLPAKIKEALEHGQHAFESKEYRIMAEMMRTGQLAHVFHPALSIPYKSPVTLVADGLIEVLPEFMKV